MWKEVGESAKNWREESEIKKCEALLFPPDKEKGTQTYTLTKNVYIDSDDYLETDSKKFFGLTPTQCVGLKGGPILKFSSIEKNADGSINHIKVRCISKENYAKEYPD